MEEVLGGSRPHQPEIVRQRPKPLRRGLAELLVDHSSPGGMAFGHLLEGTGQEADVPGRDADDGPPSVRRRHVPTPEESLMDTGVPAQDAFGAREIRFGPSDGLGAPQPPQALPARQHVQWMTDDDEDMRATYSLDPFDGEDGVH